MWIWVAAFVCAVVLMWLLFTEFTSSPWAIVLVVVLCLVAIVAFAIIVALSVDTSGINSNIINNL